MPNRFDVDLDLLEADPGVPGTTLHQQHAAGGDAREERLGRGDLLAGPAEMRWLVDDELVSAHLVESAPRGRGAGGVNAVDDEFVSGHMHPTLPGMLHQRGFRQNSTMREERRLLTVLFADVVGSTELGSQTDPEVLRQQMTRYYEQPGFGS
jgi:hypothetical protein